MTKSAMDVKFYEVFHEEEAALKSFLPDAVEADFSPHTIQASGDSGLFARLISIRTQSIIPPAWTHQVQGVLTRSQGFDHLIRYHRETNTTAVCGYLSCYCARAVAEHAIAAMMVLSRRFKQQIRQFATFDRDRLTGDECKGKNVLVVGVGRIGTEIIDMARGFRMRVRGVDIDPRVKGVEYVPLSEGVKWADIIFCALPLMKDTDGLLSKSVLQNSNPGVLLINISRGEITPLADMKELLEQKILGGLSLDVYPHEGRLADYLRGILAGDAAGEDETIKIVSELNNKDNVLFTPHNAFNTRQALQQKARLTVESVILFLESKTFPSLIFS